MAFAILPGLSVSKQSAPPSVTADFYVDSAQSDDTGDGLTPATAKKYILSGIALASAGDIVQLQDGIYPDVTDNKLYSSTLATHAANASNWITVRGETIGGVEIASELTGGTTTAIYFEFRNLKFTIAADKGLGNQYVKYIDCGFLGSASSGNSAAMSFGSNQLAEQCWFYGPGGRYKALIFEESNVILRRCVFRSDGGWGLTSGDAGFEPEGTVNVYNSNNVELQNCIIADSIKRSHSNADNLGAFIINNHITAGNVYHRGCIAINNEMAGISMEGNGTVQNCDWDNHVTIDSNGANANVNVATSNISVIRTVIMNSSGDGFADYSTSTGCTLTNSVNAGNTTQAFRNVSGNYNDVYGNGTDNGAGANDVSYNPETNGLLYPVRIEAASSLLTAGSSSGVMGATIVKRMGVDGTLYGETGYNTLQTTDLWPFPNEAIIKTEFSSVTATTGVDTGARGFCTGNSIGGDAQTLTKYIWEYLGNEIPSGIY